MDNHKSDNMNNIMEFPNNPQIRSEAADWVVKIHGYTYKTDNPLPDDQATALRAWLNQSEAHRQTFIKTLSSWDAMAVLEELADILPLSDSAPEPQQQAGLKHFIGKLLVVNHWLATLIRPRQHASTKAYSYAHTSLAAITLTAIIIGSVFWSPLSNNWLNPAHGPDYITAIGQQASYPLDDGSIITLNTNSQVHVELSDNQRRVILSRGEVNFDVAKDPNRPFVVYAGEGMVWAVGTAFNVNYSNDYVDVIVSEGTVKVFSGVSATDPQQPLNLINSGANLHAQPELADSQVILDAGETVKYTDIITAKQPLQKDHLEKKLAWQVGTLIFEGETLKEAIIEISRYTNQQLIIVDPFISNTRVGGRFKTKDIDQLLHALAKGLDIKIEKGEGNRVLFSAK